MSKRLITIFLLAFGLIAAANGSDRGSGYVYTPYGELLRTSYGECVHTAYFNPEQGLDVCGEGVDQSKETNGQ